MLYLLSPFLSAVNTSLVSQEAPQEELKVYTTMCRDVGIIRVFPGITPTTVSTFQTLSLCLSLSLSH